MENGSDGQGLIDAFFDALRLRHLKRCQRLLKKLAACARGEPALAAWHTFLTGILTFEARHDWAEAERIFAGLLQTGPEAALRGRAWYALGRCFDVQGRWPEALAAFEQSLSIADELGQPAEKVKAWKHMAISLNNGFTQGDHGPEALSQAIAYCQLALAALPPVAGQPPQPLDDDRTWLEGSIWNTLGLVHRNLGQWDAAIACYEYDLALCRALDDRFGMGLTYGNLGEIYQKRGRDHWPQALQVYRQALDLIREFDDRYQETEALANLGFLHGEMGELQAALDYYGQAIRLIEALRAGVSSEAARAGFFATVVDTYANAILLCLAAGHWRQAFDYLEHARSRSFLDLLTASSPELARQVEAAPMTLAEVQAALPDDALLLEYFTAGLEEARLDRAASRQGIQRHRFPPARTVIFAITCRAIEVHDAALSPNALRPADFDSAVERHFLKAEVRRALYERLIAPIEGLLPGKRRLYLVPHGPLHYIPFQALVAADGETLLRADGPQLVYAPSATLLFRSGHAAAGRSPGPCLALGYNGGGEHGLRFAEEEARGVARLTGGCALTGPSPKKAALYDQAASYRLAHFSCHGDFDQEAPLASALHLAPDEMLTALDVLQHLRLRCDLVTLSACESGLSRVRRGDELIGFMRAFKYAGARALVSTLWRVNERSTYILMERFYQETQNGTGLAEALKRAQLYLRNLTRREVFDVLVHLLADDNLDAGAASQRASAYLKGAATRAEGEEGVGEPWGGEAEEKIYADPFFWAPFTLVGDCGS
jgi:CHAT domain-containing protein